MHSFLKRNTPIRIINPENLKEIEAKVSKKAVYPKIFNVVVSQKIAEILELDVSNPYIEVLEIKKTGGNILYWAPSINFEILPKIDLVEFQSTKMEWTTIVLLKK